MVLFGILIIPYILRDSMVDDRRVSRRSVIAAMGATSTGLLAGCTGAGERDDWGDEPPFIAQLVFPTALSAETEKPIEPDNIYLHKDWKGTSQWADPDLMFMVTGRDVRSDGTLFSAGNSEYWARLPYQIWFRSPAPAHQIGRVTTHIEVEVPGYMEPPVGTNETKSHMFSIDDLNIADTPIGVDIPLKESGSFGRLDSLDFPQDGDDGLGTTRDLTLKFQRRTPSAYLNIPLRIHFTVGFPDLDGYDEFSQQIDCAVVNHDLKGLKEKLNETAAVWKTGRLLNTVASGAKGAGMYRMTKEWTAVQSGQLDKELVNDAVYNDLAAFKEPIDDQVLELAEDEVVIGAAGAAIGRLNEPSDDSADEVPKNHPDGEDVALDLYHPDGGNRLPTAIRVTHKESSDKTFAVDTMEVELSGTNADGVYSLAAVTDREVSEPGDEYRLTSDFLGSSSPFRADSYTVELYHNSAGDRYPLETIEVERVD